MLYAFALLFGLADAFFFPAQSAMVPKLIGNDRLQTGNAIIQGTAQLSMFVGPALAGALIAVLDGGGSAASVPDMLGIGVAFALDAASFLASITCAIAYASGPWQGGSRSRRRRNGPSCPRLSRGSPPCGKTGSFATTSC